MNDVSSRLDDRAAELRLAFDRSFMAPPRLDAAPTEDFLTVSIASEAYAIRCAEISGLIANKRITRAPTAMTAFLGIGGFRGVILPVYCLATLLGLSSSPRPRWIVIAAAAPIALAFESLDGNLRIAREQILPRETGMNERAFVAEFLREGDRVRAILHLPSILEGIRRRKSGTGAVEEG